MNTFELVENVVVDSVQVADSVRDIAQKKPHLPAAPRVLGWQKAILNINAVCRDCNVILPRCTEAAMAISEGSVPVQIICLSCLSLALEKQ